MTKKEIEHQLEFLKQRVDTQQQTIENLVKIINNLDKKKK